MIWRFYAFLDQLFEKNSREFFDLTHIIIHIFLTDEIIIELKDNILRLELIKSKY